jgi:hypothetical protein
VEYVTGPTAGVRMDVKACIVRAERLLKYDGRTGLTRCVHGVAQGAKTSLLYFQEVVFRVHTALDSEADNSRRARKEQAPFHWYVIIVPGYIHKVSSLIAIDPDFGIFYRFWKMQIKGVGFLDLLLTKTEYSEMLM